MALCLGLPGWAGTRRNIHPLTPLLLINHPYQLPPSTTNHSIIPAQSTYLAIFLHNLWPCLFCPTFFWIRDYISIYEFFSDCSIGDNLPCWCFGLETHFVCSFTFQWSVLQLPSVLWCCWLGSKKSIRPVKRQWCGVQCWHGYLSVAKCKWLAYGPADAIATLSLVLQ